MTLHSDTQFLVQYLRDCAAENKLATYQEMTDLISADVQFKSRSRLTTALSIVKRDYNILFDVVPSVGYRVLGGRESVEVLSEKHKCKIRRETQRWESDLQAVDTTKLDEKDKSYFEQNIVALQIQQIISKPEADKTLQGFIVKNTSKASGVKEILASGKAALRHLLDCC